MLIEESFAYILLAFYFVIAISFSVLTNWLFLRFSRNLGLRNPTQIAEIRWSATEKPALGGISFYIIFLLSISTLNILPNESDSVFNKEVIGIVAATSLGFIIGLADDAYNTNPLVKFIGQMTCAFMLITMDVYIELTSISSINFIVTTLWVIGLMNSINMLDNMDAIAGTVSVTIISGAIVLLMVTGDITSKYAILLTGVLGGLMGFLFFNWHPSKIFMGDTGSQFLGVFLAAISIISFWDPDFKDIPGRSFQLKQFVIPMLLFIVPLIDTITVVIRRLLRRQSPFVGGKDHITHHLAYLGIPDSWVSIILLVISLISVPVVALMVMGIIPWTKSTTFFAFLYFAVLFTIFQFLYNKGLKMNKAKKT